MNQNRKATALIVAAVMLLAATPAVAQTKSQTASVTKGIFTTDVDNYMNVNTYDKVMFDKWFGVIAADGTTPQLGFATKIGGLYLGTSYKGTLYNSSGNDTINIVTTPTVTDGVVSSTATTTTKSVTSSSLNTNNTVGVLVGALGMGFSASFSETMNHSNIPYYVTSYASAPNASTGQQAIETTTDNPAGKTATSTKYTNNYNNSGSMTPSLGWGMNLNVGTMILRPSASVAATFNKNEKSATKAASTTVNEVETSSDTGTCTTALSNLEPTATIGAILEFPKIDGAQAFAILTYRLDTKFFIGNSYLDANGTSIALPGNAYVTAYKQVTDNPALEKTTTTGTDILAYTDSYMMHTVTPQFKFKKEFDDQLSIGFLAKANVSAEFSSTGSTRTNTTVVTVDSYSQNPGSDTTETTTVTTNGNTTATATYEISPEASAAVVYKLLPGKLSLNAGYSLSAPKLTSTQTTVTKSLPDTTTVKKVDENGFVLTDTETTTVNAARTESQTLTNTWGAISQTLSAGLTFYINDKMTFDASMSTSGTNVINLANLTLMFTIKQ